MDKQQVIFYLKNPIPNTIPNIGYLLRVFGRTCSAGFHNEKKSYSPPWLSGAGKPYLGGPCYGPG